MKFLKVLAALIAIVGGGLIAGGLFLPAETSLSRSIVLNAPMATVWAEVADLRKQHEWSPWREEDPNMTVTFSDASSGVGAKMDWDGPKSGKGWMQIAAVNEGKDVTQDLDFGQQGKAQATWTLTGTDGAVEVIWGFKSTHNNLLARYFGLMIERMLGPVYEKGLANLKGVVEAPPAATVPPAEAPAP